MMWYQIEMALTQSMRDVLLELARLLPRMLGFSAALLGGVLLAWMVGALLRRSLTRAEFDSRVRQWGFSELADWSPQRSPTRLLVLLTGGTFLLLGMMIGVSVLYPALMTGLLTRFLSYLPQVILAVLILLGGALLGRYLGRGVLISAVNMQIGSAHLLSVGVKWMILVIASAMALEHVGIGGRIVPLAFTILFGGIVLALALAIGLGSKDVVSRSWQRQETRRDQDVEEPFLHL